MKIRMSIEFDDLKEASKFLAQISQLDGVVVQTIEEKGAANLPEFLKTQNPNAVIDPEDDDE